MSANRSRQMYMYDNTARQLDVRRAIEEEPKKRLSTAARKNRDKAVNKCISILICTFIGNGQDGRARRH